VFKKNIKKLLLVISKFKIFYGPFISMVFGKYIKNVRTPKDSTKGRALLIYITLPFKNLNINSHTNLQEAQVIADVLSDLGFVVDVMDYRNAHYVEVSHYDLIMGFGDFFENLFFQECDSFKIHYATGAPISIHNFAEVKRVRNLRESNIKVNPVRIIDRSWPASELLSNAIISVTDGWANDMYKQNHQNVYSVPITYLQPQKNYVFDSAIKNKKNYIWFGGFGGVHKGLDLCLEVFKNKKELTLHVCGLSIDKEADFINEYKDLLSLENVVWHGRLDIDKAVEIIDLCQFTILPSCSEGCATSVLTCMARGCIPIVTEQAGIEFPKRITVKDLSVQSVNSAVEITQCLDHVELAALSKESATWCKSKHNINIFKDKMTHILSKLVK
jgi:hypothetical protein